MLQKFEKWAAPLNRNVAVQLCLPDDYESSQERYPVMYMFDGQNLFRDSEASFGESWRLEDFFRGCQKPFIIVGIESSRTGSERLQEYMPFQSDDCFFGPASGLGAAMMDWVVNDLKPYIDRFWRTWPHREATGIGGSSMGGLMAMHGITRYNQIFSKAACLSPSFMICAEAVSEEFFEAELDPDTRIYWSFGSRELTAKNRLYAQRLLQDYITILTAKGGKGLMRIIPEGRHNEVSWRRETPIYTEFLWFDPSWYKEDDWTQQ